MGPEKQAMVEEIERRVSAASFVLVADYHGLKVEQMKDLRAQLKGAGAEMAVVKNRLLRRVVENRGWSGLGMQLRGPSAMVVGREVTLAAKALRKFAEDNNSRPVVKGGVLGDAMLSSADVEALTKLPGREALIGMVVRTLAAPLSRLAGVMHRKVATLLYVLKAIEAKKSA